MRKYKYILRFLAVIDVMFAEKFILITYKEDFQTSKTTFDKREFLNGKKNAPTQEGEIKP